MGEGDERSWLAELSRDMERADGSKVLLGVVLIIAAIAMTLGMTQSPDPLRFAIVFFLGTLPTVLLGSGIIVKELSEAGGERRRLARADEGDVARIRSAIAEERALPARGAADPAPDASESVEAEHPTA